MTTETMALRVALKEAIKDRDEALAAFARVTEVIEEVRQQTNPHWHGWEPILVAIKAAKEGRKNEFK